ncbi:hypothetical protein IFM89_006650 [Coptis chinensis]|uniref:DUF4283 domain-containing protein n=1 Tax=Coptis chinensis TaxID=261450 RepID=A0A835IYK2_9MAGN|nr:hypothetical protein IFM89_006650 [Coptis chinensis]
MWKKLSRIALETWKPKGDWKIISLGKGFFMIQLTYEDDWRKRWCGGPWKFKDQTLRLTKWAFDLISRREDLAIPLVLTNIPQRDYGFLLQRLVEAKNKRVIEKQAEDVQKQKKKKRNRNKNKNVPIEPTNNVSVETMGTVPVEVPTTTPTEVVPIDVGTVDIVVEQDAQTQDGTDHIDAIPQVGVAEHIVTDVVSLLPLAVEMQSMHPLNAPQAEEKGSKTKGKDMDLTPLPPGARKIPTKKI